MTSVPVAALVLVGFVLLVAVAQWLSKRGDDLWERDKAERPVRRVRREQRRAAARRRSEARLERIEALRKRKKA